MVRDLKRAVILFTEAADAGYRPSLANLALMYSKGEGVAQSQIKALEYGSRAADAGDLQSQFNLGQAYRRGMGVAQDYGEVARWYQKAAEAGNEGGFMGFGGVAVSDAEKATLADISAALSTGGSAVSESQRV